jgi:hypothetical protein
MIYMQSTIELKAGGEKRFAETLNAILPIVEPLGWHLVAAMVQVTGRLHTAVDVWRMESLDTYARGLAGLRSHARYPEISKVLAEVVERETVVLGHKASWLPEGRMEA